MRYELFNRLNTGGASLSEQEIRNCIFRGVSSEFNDYLERIAKNENFINLINISQQKKSEGYLEELVLRISSLYNNWSNVDTKHMSKYLTKFMENAVKNGFDYSFENILERTINILTPLGPSIFRFSNNQLSTSLIDAIFIGIAMNIDKYESLNPDQVLEKINLLKSDGTFRKYTGPDASSKSRVVKRIDRSMEVFSDI